MEEKRSIISKRLPKLIHSFDVIIVCTVRDENKKVFYVDGYRIVEVIQSSVDGIWMNMRFSYPHLDQGLRELNSNPYIVELTTVYSDFYTQDIRKLEFDK